MVMGTANIFAHLDQKIGGIPSLPAPIEMSVVSRSRLNMLSMFSKSLDIGTLPCAYVEATVYVSKGIAKILWKE